MELTRQFVYLIAAYISSGIITGIVCVCISSAASSSCSKMAIAKVFGCILVWPILAFGGFIGALACLCVWIIEGDKK